MAGKRGNGEGSIRQIKEKLWEGRYSAGVNPGTGKQIQKSVYGKTRAEVVTKLRDATKSVAEGTFVEPSKMKLAAWLDIWLKDYTANVKESIPPSRMKPKLEPISSPRWVLWRCRL